MTVSSIQRFPTLAIAPTRVLRGCGLVSDLATELRRWGSRALVVVGDRAGALVRPVFAQIAAVDAVFAPAIADCTESVLSQLRDRVAVERPHVLVGVGGGKVMDAVKLLGQQCDLPVVTVPTSGATCAAWTALSNVYSDDGAFLYDVPLDRCPDLVVVDYDLIATAPNRTLVAGIGDAIAKWYEASVSSGTSERTMVVAAVQEARILRDLLLQKSAAALGAVGSEVWRDVVDATVCLAGVIGGLGGAQCRTVAAHAVHNGLTHLARSRGTLHGEKVAYGILVQLRLEEANGNQLAATARHQLLKFYDEIGLPKTLADLGMADVTLSELERAAAIACAPHSDIHHLPFPVHPSQVVAAMVSTVAPLPAAV